MQYTIQFLYILLASWWPISTPFLSNMCFPIRPSRQMPSFFGTCSAAAPAAKLFKRLAAMTKAGACRWRWGLAAIFKRNQDMCGHDLSKHWNKSWICWRECGFQCWQCLNFGDFFEELGSFINLSLWVHCFHLNGTEIHIHNTYKFLDFKPRHVSFKSLLSGISPDFVSIPSAEIP